MNQSLLEDLTAQRDKALMEGDMETFLTVSKQIPMPAEVAEALRAGIGEEEVASWGFNIPAQGNSYDAGTLSK